MTQDMHAVEALSLLKVFAEHLSQVSADCLSPNVPAAHALHATPSHAVPSPHGTHVPSIRLYPALQMLHSKLPARECDPTAQSRHVAAELAPILDEYLPAEQLRQDPGPTPVLYEPAGHAEQFPPSIPVYPSSHLQSERSFPPETIVEFTPQL